MLGQQTHTFILKDKPQVSRRHVTLGDPPSYPSLWNLSVTPEHDHERVRDLHVRGAALRVRPGACARAAAPLLALAACGSGRCPPTGSSFRLVPRANTLPHTPWGKDETEGRLRLSLVISPHSLPLPACLTFRARASRAAAIGEARAPLLSAPSGRRGLCWRSPPPAPSARRPARPPPAAPPSRSPAARSG